ncbi:jouberin isoform X2 [Polypterus senegalus]|uniref:jouberin isoform X2 n=1 Tax=Polypterus senegalus TaxID=55291 RepID=UPI0019642A3B|nr:jouberin isoform X2 [Polypterus senegalus]
MPAGENETKQKTKSRLEDVFKSYTGLPTDKKKSKKKSTPNQEEIALDALKKSLDLQKKTEDDETILNNTYNSEEQSPRFTKNKLRDLKTASTEKIINSFYNEEEPKHVKPKKKKKKEAVEDPRQNEGNYDGLGISVRNEDSQLPKAVTNNPILESDDIIKNSSKRTRKVPRLPEERELTTNMQEYDIQVQQTNEDAIRMKLKKKIAEKMMESMEAINQEVVLNNETEQKKKKKKKERIITIPKDETSVLSAPEQQDDPIEGTSKKKNKEEIVIAKNSDDAWPRKEEKEEIIEEQPLPMPKGKKKKKKKKDESLVEERPAEDIISAEPESETFQNEVKHSFDESLVLGVYIHRTDRLKTDMMVSHPMVKVYVVDETTGEYLRKENSCRPVSSFYEQEKVEHILPIMTQPYDFKKYKSTVPEWEEQIVFNERFGYFLQENEQSPKVILFFEVLDFMSMDEARANFELQTKHERGFRKIAWAFLKLVGTNNVLNVDNKVRLQLYYPHIKSRTKPNIIEIYEGWKKFPRNRYPSTLYVTIKGLKLPEKVDPSVRSMMALQQERGTTSYSELQSEMAGKGASLLQDEKTSGLMKWSRLPGQVCRIPNKLFLSFKGGQMGCFAVRFSHNGNILATACADKDGYPIVAYEIPSGKVLGAFNGHLNIVYDLSWSKDDKSLISASSDGTVRVWNMETFQGLVDKVLPHPSFVYASQFHPAAQYLVVTGGYDCVIRIWNVKVKNANGQLLQEFDGHKSFINTLCFSKDGINMFSGDSSGLIIVWNTFADENFHLRQIQQWGIEKEIQENDLKGVPINHLEVHPNGRRLLIHAKDSTLRIMDLRILAAKKYTGATNYREKIHSNLTPCGSFLFSGSEDGMAYVWNAETGDQVAVYSELCYSSPLRDVAFHPHENMVAFCAFGSHHPVYVYLYDRKVAQMEAEAVKDVEGHLIATVPKGPRFLCNVSDVATLQDSTLASMDGFARSARKSMRKQQVMQLLDSVLEPLQHNVSATDYMYENSGMISAMSGGLINDNSIRSPVSSTYFQTVSSNVSLPAPSLLSPHSKLRLPSSFGTQLIAPQSLTSHSGRFSPVGQRFARTPSFKLHTSLADPSASFLRFEANVLPTVQQRVVALYDYTANRSDELTIRRGDIIQVLYKDNDNWWFGHLANGQQGYFPANYVADETGYEEDLSRTLEPNSETSNQQEEAEQRTPTPTKMTAVISRRGELKLISEHETDSESPAYQVHKKKKKKTTSGRKLDAAIPQYSSESAAVEQEQQQQFSETVRKRRPKSHVKHSDGSGNVNDGFQVD